MAKGLTEKQRAVLTLIEDYWNKHEIAPSVADVAQWLGISKAAAHDHLLALKKKGFLVHSQGVGRSWRPVSLSVGTQGQRVPLLGRIAAGTPIMAQENIEDWIYVDSNKREETLFALRVSGDSMMDAGIIEGDIIVVRLQNTAISGDIVVALIDDMDATVKRLMRIGKIIELKPENSAMKTMRFAVDRVRIQGKVIGLTRNYR